MWHLPFSVTLKIIKNPDELVIADPGSIHLLGEEGGGRKPAPHSSKYSSSSRNSQGPICQAAPVQSAAKRGREEGRPLCPSPSFRQRAAADRRGDRGIFKMSDQAAF